jgi:cation diffusion facilitator family transporter
MNITQSEKYNIAKKGAWVGIIGNFFLAGLKIITGVVGRSFALISDGVHSLSDITSSVAVLVGLTIASKPKDKAHPYGHGKAESVASITIAALLIIVAFMLIVKVIYSFLENEPIIEPAFITLWIALASVILKEILYRYKAKLGKNVKSTSLIADAWHHRSDALSSGVVLVGIAGSIFGGPGWQYLDKIAGFIVAGIIVWVGIKIYARASSELMDESVDKEVVKVVKEKAQRVKGVKRVETLLVRKSGLDFLVDIHIEVDPKLDVTTSHNIAESVECKILEEIPEVKSVIAHIEPYS